MTQKIFVDRSRYEDYQRCNRKRFHAYHDGPERIGIDSLRKPLPLAVGGSVHVGIATLLRSSMGIPLDELSFLLAETHAVRDALANFAQYAKVLDLPDAEQAALAVREPNPESLLAQLQDSLGQDSTAQRAADSRDARSELDDYLYAEQSALVEALVRAYARRRLRPLLEQFEVLEVEREGEWLLAESCGDDLEGELWFMSRPDALLLERSTRQLYLLSLKTIGSWDLRKARDAEHDMQGMSEGIEVERRLAVAWNTMAKGWAGKPEDLGLNESTFKFLIALDAPPRIHAVRYEYMLKGERWTDKDLSAQIGAEVRTQRSHLIRCYEAVSTPQRGTAGFSLGDLCWSWEFTLDDGRQSKLAWQNWKSRPVWERPGGVRAWIDKLDDSAPLISGEDATMGLEPRMLGYKSDAQAVGVTQAHPLDSVFLPPVTVYRNDDELRDLIDQMEAQERRVAEGVAAVGAAQDEGERRHLLNIHFPQTRRACEYPTTCTFSKICYGGEDIRRDPLGSGLYKIRKANHPQELEGQNG